MTRKKNAVKGVQPKAIFNYTSECCTAPAKKPALIKTEEAEGTLGHWHCSKCERNCKVKRSRVKAEDNGESTGTID